MTIAKWIEGYRNFIKYQIEPVELDKIDGWELDDHCGIIRRKDHAFFTVKAVKSDKVVGNMVELPIIDQPEIGILGFILSRDKYGEKILLQAKSEPGNKFISQIGPSVQATESNYKSKHNGKPQTYIEFFLNNQHPKLISIEQSEQGTRFLNKYNLNTIVEVDESQIKIDDQKYHWFYLEDIISALNSDYLFNTDFKSVFSQLLESIILEKIKRNPRYQNPFLNSYARNTGTDLIKILDTINQKRTKYSFNVSIIKLNKLKNWEISRDGISPADEKSFGFQFFRIAFSDREVPHWGQPLITKSSKEMIILLCAEVHDEILFVFKDSPEIGFKNFLQLGPTYQFDVPDDMEHFDINGECIVQFMQSEEGGRFYQNISEYKIYKVGSVKPFEADEDYHVLNLYQICQLLKIKGVFTNEARNIISGLVSLLP